MRWVVYSKRRGFSCLHVWAFVRLEPDHRLLQLNETRAAWYDRVGVRVRSRGRRRPGGRVYAVWGSGLGLMLR